ncbi:MAG: type VI secretion system-associated protein TagF, partial [Pseudomonadota bacterium]
LMTVALFGKLPAKGDFVSRGMPPELQRIWDRWLSQVFEGARQQLAEQWPSVYVTAPVWRFWIGDAVFGHAVTGALAPSMDKVGREFPLSVFLHDAGEQHPAPPVAGDGNEAWYATLDQLMLGATSHSFDGDIDRLLGEVALPEGTNQAAAEDDRRAFFAFGEEGLAPLLQDVREHDHQLAAAGRSYWWTAGNDRAGPAMLALNGMLDPQGFAAMLVGFGKPVAAEMALEDTDKPPVDTAGEAASTPVLTPVPDLMTEPTPFDTEAGWYVNGPDLPPTLDDNPEDEESPFGALPTSGIGIRLGFGMAGEIKK